MLHMTCNALTRNQYVAGLKLTIPVLKMTDTSIRLICISRFISHRSWELLHLGINKAMQHLFIFFIAPGSLYKPYRALSNVADGVFPMAPNPTPTAKPSVHTNTQTTEKMIKLWNVNKAPTDTHTQTHIQYINIYSCTRLAIWKYIQVYAIQPLAPCDHCMTVSPPVCRPWPASVSFKVQSSSLKITDMHICA